MAHFELPEIETLRRDLERDIVGKKVKSVDLKSLKSIEGHRTKKSFTSGLEGAKVLDVVRVGLTIVITLDNEHALLLDLADGCRLERVASKTETDSDTEITITFTQTGDLRIVDSTGETVVRLVSLDDLDEALGDPAERGLDLLSEPIPWIEFGRFVLQRTEPLKVLLTDPSVFMGIGPIYSDEILFDAGLRYDRPANELTTQELRRLQRSIVSILHDAIKYGGTSIESRPFHSLAGEEGNFGEHLAVYGRAGELSPRSRTPIEKATFKKRTVYYCTTQV
ncbi:MAG: DNA-formamidopyrimidine glycosylase family protein [Acidimicrobiales bacterium]